MSVLPDTDTVYAYEWQDTITLAIHRAQPSGGRDIFAKMNLSVKDAEDLIKQLQNCITLNNYRRI